MHDPDISIALNVSRAIDLSVLQNCDLVIGISWIELMVCLNPVLGLFLFQLVRSSSPIHPSVTVPGMVAPTVVQNRI